MVHKCLRLYQILHHLKYVKLFPAPWIHPHQQQSSCVPLLFYSCSWTKLLQSGFDSERSEEYYKSEGGHRDLGECWGQCAHCLLLPLCLSFKYNIFPFFLGQRWRTGLKLTKPWRWWTSLWKRVAGESHWSGSLMYKSLKISWVTFVCRCYFTETFSSTKDTQWVIVFALFERNLNG